MGTHARTKPTKPAGWRGTKDSRYWTKCTTAHGWRAMCSDCGVQSDGFGKDHDRRAHHLACPRIAGPRREWRAWVNADGVPKVQQEPYNHASWHETRGEALMALDMELAAQQDAIARQREQVAAMLREPTAEGTP